MKTVLQKRTISSETLEFCAWYSTPMSDSDPVGSGNMARCDLQNFTKYFKYSSRHQHHEDWRIIYIFAAFVLVPGTVHKSKCWYFSMIDKNLSDKVWFSSRSGTGSWQQCVWSRSGGIRNCLQDLDPDPQFKFRIRIRKGSETKI